MTVYLDRAVASVLATMVETGGSPHHTERPWTDGAPPSAREVTR